MISPSWAQANHRRWCRGEAYRVTRGAYSVQELRIAQALALLPYPAVDVARRLFLNHRSK